MSDQFKEFFLPGSTRPLRMRLPQELPPGPTQLDAMSPNAAMELRGEKSRVTGLRDDISPPQEVSEEPFLSGKIPAPETPAPTPRMVQPSKSESVRQYVSDKKSGRSPDWGRLIADIGSNIAHRSGRENDPFFEQQQAYEDATHEREAKASFLRDSGDPASSVSTMGRSIMERTLGKPLPQSMSWAQIQQVLPAASKLHGEELEREYRNAQLAQQARAVDTKSGSLKPMTEVQGRAMQFFEKGKMGSDQLDMLSSKGFVPSRGRGLLPNEFKSADSQMFDTAAEAFVNAILRHESGAAISPGEFERQKKESIPEPGDTPERLAQKAAFRKVLVESRRSVMGMGQDEYQKRREQAGLSPEIASSNQIIASAAPSAGIRVRNMANGRTATVPTQAEADALVRDGGEIVK